MLVRHTVSDDRRLRGCEKIDREIFGLFQGGVTPYREQANRSWAILRGRECELTANRGPFRQNSRLSIFSHTLRTEDRNSESGENGPEGFLPSIFRPLSSVRGALVADQSGILASVEKKASAFALAARPSGSVASGSGSIGNTRSEMKWIWCGMWIIALQAPRPAPRCLRDRLSIPRRLPHTPA